MSIGDFRIDKADIRYSGENLSRPECVLAERDGTLWISDDRGGVTRLDPDGRQTVIGSISGTPNGLAMERDGSLLIANMEDGKLYRLQRDGKHEIVFDHFPGKPVGAGCNFVYRDPAADRMWMTISTATMPRHHAVVKPIPDGYVLLLQNGKVSIAADGICFTNEVRIDRAGRFLYVAETAKGRILRYPLQRDGGLGAQEVFGPDPIAPESRVDGIAFDAEDNLWVTEVANNGIYVIAPNGTCRCVFEDRAGEAVLFPASLCFAGPDLRTVYIGSIKMNRLAVFRAPVAGAPLAHWNS
jgi:gluconolactonase